MWETIFNVLKLLGILGGIVAAVIAAKIWLREQGEMGVSKAKDDVIKLMQAELVLSRSHAQLRDEEAKLAREKAERDIGHYRDEVHSVRNAANGTVVAAQADLDAAKEISRRLEVENAGLKAKTDLSPIMDVVSGFIAEQTKINREVLSGMEKISHYFEKINGRLAPALAALNP